MRSLHHGQVFVAAVLLRIHPKAISARPNQKIIPRSGFMVHTTQPAKVQSTPPRINKKPTISPSVRMLSGNAALIGSDAISYPSGLAN